MDKDKKHISHSLLMSYLLNEIGDKQRLDVDNWLSNSEDNKTYLKSLEMLWIESGKLKPPPIPVNTQTAWDNVSSKLNFNDSTNILEIKKEKTSNLKYLWRIAAVLIVILGVYSILKFIAISPEIETFADANNIKNDTLNDGSVISLNANSKLRYPKKFKKNYRKVKLEGEAFFDVEHDEERPFSIELDGALIEVLGTSFNVKELPEEHLIEVYVKSGTVKLSSVNVERDTSSIVIKKGEKGILNTKSGIATKPVDVGMNALDISWLNDTFEFDGVRLEYVAEFLESFYDIKINFKNEQTKDRLLTATFENDNIDEILNVIAASFSLDIRKENQIYLINEIEE